MVWAAYSHDPRVIGDQHFFQSEMLKLHHDTIYFMVSSHVVVSEEVNDVRNTQVVVEEAS